MNNEEHDSDHGPYPDPAMVFRGVTAFIVVLAVDGSWSVLLDPSINLHIDRPPERHDIIPAASAVLAVANAELVATTSIQTQLDMIEALQKKTRGEPHDHVPHSGSDSTPRGDAVPGA
jgi:hypothetical protein